jgi:hypothetical protein
LSLQIQALEKEKPLLLLITVFPFEHK